MQSLIFPAVLLLLVALWGVFSVGSKFRREFKVRGKEWDEVCAAMRAGDGILIVDILWGPQRGLGHPVIWWLPNSAGAGEDLSESLKSAARLVKCPRHLRSIQALRREFAPDRVRSHGWDVDPNSLHRSNS